MCLEFLQGLLYGFGPSEGVCPRWYDVRSIEFRSVSVCQRDCKRQSPAGRRLKIKYITQAKTRPPGFVVSCSRPDSVPQSYVRYLTNSLRESFGLDGVPIRIAMRASDNPYASKAKKKR